MEVQHVHVGFLPLRDSPSPNHKAGAHPCSYTVYGPVLSLNEQIWKTVPLGLKILPAKYLQCFTSSYRYIITALQKYIIDYKHATFAGKKPTRIFPAIMGPAF